MRRSRPLENALILMLIATTTCIGPTVRAEEPLSAMIPVEVLEVDPALATGELWRGVVKWSEPAVALQPARVARAIAIDKAGQEPDTRADVARDARTQGRWHIEPRCRFGSSGLVRAE